LFSCAALEESDGSLEDDGVVLIQNVNCME
jgi:hypothetical protein